MLITSALFTLVANRFAVFSLLPMSTITPNVEVFINEVHPPAAMQGVPSDDYYPSAKIRLTIRFDEFADPSVVQAARAKVQKPPIKKKGVSDQPSLTQGPDPNAPPGVRRILLQGGGAAPGGPQKQGSSNDAYTHTLVGIIPKQATLGLNGYKQADTLSLTLRWLDCPIDPRTVRSAAIEFYLGTVTAQDFADGVAGKSRNSLSTFLGTTGEGPLNLVPDSYQDINGQQRTNLRFQGWVDMWTTEWDENDDPMVKLECRDNTSILIDQVAPPKLVVGQKKPLDQAVADYLANFPQFTGLSVEYRPPGASPPVLSAVLSKTAVKGGQGPPPAKGGGATSADSKTSVIDYLTDVCGMVGHIIRVEGTNVIIERPHTFLSGQFTRSDDPFKQRTINGQTFYNRRMIWGRNIQSLKQSRSYAKTTPQNVEVRCMVAETKQLLIAQYPNTSKQTGSSPQNKTVQSVQPGNNSNEKWLVKNVFGVKDQATLNLIAQSVYEQLGRNEFQCTLKTRSLGSFGGQNEDPDLLDMIAGDGLTVLVTRDDQGDTFSSQSMIETVLALQANAQRFYTTLGYDADFAQAAAKAFTNGGFLTTYYVRSMNVMWNVEDGVSFDISAINYLTVRDDGSLPSGQELPSPTAYI